jgi:hypothetical protein
VTNIIIEIKRPASGGEFLSPPPVVIFDTVNEVVKLPGENCLGLVCKAFTKFCIIFSEIVVLLIMD